MMSEGFLFASGIVVQFFRGHPRFNALETLIGAYALAVIGVFLYLHPATVPDLFRVAFDELPRVLGGTMVATMIAEARRKLNGKTGTMSSVLRAVVPPRNNEFQKEDPKP